MEQESIKLGSYDRRILFELDRNARQSTTQIGKKIRKSKQFVDYRINKLEELKVLKGYTSVIDYSKLGYLSMRVYFKFQNLSPEKQKEIEESLTKDKEVWWLVTLEGVWDVGYAVAVKDVIDFYKYWDEVVKKYGKYIQKRSVVVYTHIRQFPKSYLIEEPNTDKGTFIGVSKEDKSVKEFDLKLLKILSDNARIPLIELAEKLHTSPNVVKKHLRDLESKGIIQSYRAIIDVSFLSYRYYKSYINLLHSDNLTGFEAFCLKHPNILNTNRTIGGRDFEIELQARSFDEFELIMNELRSKFPGMINDFEFVIAREEKKIEYFPF
ncbi:Lrp/AsnC family transcriptional regulator [Candidatus Pacearchaeota archaeon]|nr:Lrp/AsnC family transcriptional regulator [Candidatus Pacearchaeota archaeon]